MTRERRVDPSVVRYLGPVAIAQFVDLGWFTFWPIGITKRGRAAFRSGYGYWDGNLQHLPSRLAPGTTRPADLPYGNPGFPNWEGRLARLPGQARSRQSDDDDSKEED